MVTVAKKNTAVESTLNSLSTTQIHTFRFR